MKRKGRIVVLHLAMRFPFAGVVWQLLQHLIGFRALGFEVFYIEDHGAYVYDAVAQTPTPDSSSNIKLVGEILDRFGFAGHWSFRDPISQDYIGMPKERCLKLFRESAAVVNLCGASEPREEHIASPMFIYIETDPGVFQRNIEHRDPIAMLNVEAHKLFFTYASNIGQPDCNVPAAGVDWHTTRPPVMLDEWHPGIGPASPSAFTTVGTWRNKGNDITVAGNTYYWSKHVNFTKVLEVAARAGQPIELATDISSGEDYDRAIAGGFTFRPVIPMSLDIDTYREYISASRGEFTVSKDLYVRTRSGWFSDRTVCYLAAGRPAITQFTGFEKYISSGTGLLGFDDADSAIEAIRIVNSDYPRHARAAREIASEYFDAIKLLDEIVTTAGI
ncbi:MAG TPA: hypothetical protein VN867_12575 [Candidatus Binataceae bacterium]|nr:hypothetical protein [Candidatus Binataceae bacterium]